MLPSPEAIAPPLAPPKHHLLFAVISIGSCFAIGLAAYFEFVATRPPSFHELPPRTALALDNLHDLATVAFPVWRAAHPGTACPASIEELARYSSASIHGPYRATPIRYSCDESIMPAHVHGIILVDPGEDDRFGTGDDLTSAQEPR